MAAASQALQDLFKEFVSPQQERVLSDGTLEKFDARPPEVNDFQSYVAWRASQDPSIAGVNTELQNAIAQSGQNPADINLKALFPETKWEQGTDWGHFGNAVLATAGLVAGGYAAGAFGGGAGTGMGAGSGITATAAEGGLGAGLAASAPEAAGMTGALGSGITVAPVASGSLAAAAPIAGALGSGLATTGASGALAPGAFASETLTAPAFAGEVATTSAGGSSLVNTVKNVLGLGSDEEADGILDSILKLGLPIATIAGLFEKPDNPLLGPIVQAAQKSIGKADEFSALGPIGLTPAQQQAIDLAKENVGSYKPYLEKSGALADTAAAGITQDQIDRYTNPYLRGVLDPQIRDIEEAAARRRESLRAVTSMSGNDLRTPSTDPNRFNIEDSLLDRETLRTIGDVSGKAYSDAFGQATGLAGQDLDRSLSSSNIYGGLGKAAGALGAADVSGLTAAGALERLPQEDERQQVADASKLYTSVVHGNQGALSAAAQPSTLTNVAGALGTLKTAKDLDLF